jgi:hypothetical protein
MHYYMTVLEIPREILTHITGRLIRGFCTLPRFSAHFRDMAPDLALTPFRRVGRVSGAELRLLAGSTSPDSGYRGGLNVETVWRQCGDQMEIPPSGRLSMSEIMFSGKAATTVCTEIYDCTAIAGQGITTRSARGRENAEYSLPR